MLMGPCRCLCVLMNLYGSFWVFIYSNGSFWVFKIRLVSLWTLKGPIGFLLILIGFYEF